MSDILSLQQAREKLNMPFASDAEVRQAAQRNNITILDLNLSGVRNTANLSDLNQNVGGSLFGAKVDNSQTSGLTSLTQNNGLQTPQLNTNVNMPLQSGNIWTDSKPVLSGGSSVLSDNTASQDTTGIFQNWSKGSLSSLISQFTQSSIEKGNELHSKIEKFKGSESYIDPSRVVSIEYGKDGHFTQILDDGQRIEHTIPEDKRQDRYSKIEFVDGQVRYYDLDGKLLSDQTRAAHFGERGYVKTGNSIDEDLQQKCGDNKHYNKLQDIQAQKAQLQEQMEALPENDPEKAKLQEKIKNLEDDEKKQAEKLTKEYAQRLIEECDGDPVKLHSKLMELRNNSDISTAAGSQFFKLIAQLDNSMKGKNFSREDLIKIYQSSMDDTDPEQAAENARLVGESVIGGKGRRAKFQTEAAGQAAKNNHQEESFTGAVISGVADHKVVDEDNAQAIASTVASICPDRVGELAHAITNPTDGVQYSDNMKIRYSGGFSDAGAITGNEDVMQAEQDVITSIQSADAQIEAAQNSRIRYSQDDVSNETREKHSATVGSNLGNYHKDAQLPVDESEREFEKEFEIHEAYTRAVAEILQNVQDAKNQRELAQRTIDSGNEDAINSMAQHAYEYDESNRDEIIEMIKENGSEKTLEILENSRKEYEAQDAANKELNSEIKANNESKAQLSAQEQATQARQNTQTPKQTSRQSFAAQPQSQTTAAPASKRPFAAFMSFGMNPEQQTANFGLSAVQTHILSPEFKSASISEKQKYINSLDPTNKKQAISTIVENSQAYQLNAYMQSSLKNDILKYLVNHPDGKNKETLNYLKGFLSGGDLKYVEKLKDERDKRLGFSNENIASDVDNNKRKTFNFEV